MTEKFFNNQLINKIGHTPTNGQTIATDKFYQFLTDKEKFCIFLLKGYAGTGKTTLISALINTLSDIKINTVLLAPTGRAAKVLSTYSGKKAYTIHKCIYRKKSTKATDSDFSINFNKNKDTVYIVDEASMIGNIDTGNSIFGSGRLLDDLLAFVFNDNNCRLILVGDTAQLPPVGTILSPALDEQYLKATGMKVYVSELSEVVRQSAESGILVNATQIREKISSDNFDFQKFKLEGFQDIVSIPGGELLDELESCYSKYGSEETKIICRSNKTANKYNLGIRNRILWKEEEISNGDLLMIVKNNYSWLPENAEIEFIANGDIVEVVRVGRKYELYNHRYADLTIKFVDFPELEIEVKAILDTLSLDLPAMDTEYHKKLYDLLLLDYADILDAKKRHEAILADPYFNALQIKFAYALTCHKSQGGQWSAVFVDHGWLNKEGMNEQNKYEFLRWLYTAVTRATEKLYLVNFDKDFLE
ncbi:MAG TPA: AAA family ATPase [Bacteroidales bacterium]|nr:AAA family ATPase [Bacteroidales bacterium]